MKRLALFLASDTMTDIATMVAALLALLLVSAYGLAS